MQVTIQYSYDRLADLLSEAFEGGMPWARIIGYKKPTEEINLSIFNNYNEIFKHIHYPLFQGGQVKVEDIEDGQKYVLNLEKIQEGMETFARLAPHHFGDWLSENDDAETGSVFLQCCLFGEVKY